MGSANAGNVIGLPHVDSRGTESAQQSVIATASQCRMSLSRRPKILLDTNVNLHIPTLKPHASAFGQQGRLLDFLHPEKLSVEQPRRIFAAGWGCQLHMINLREWN